MTNVSRALFGSSGILLTLWSCATSSLRPALSPGNTRSVSAFEAVVRTVLDSARNVPVRIDPRPMLHEDESLELSTESFESAADSVVRLRLGILRTLRVDTIDATLVGLNARCPGYLAAAEDSASYIKERENCPRSEIKVVTIGMPRTGDAVPSGNGPYDSERRTARQGFWPFASANRMSPRAEPTIASMTTCCS